MIVKNLFPTPLALSENKNHDTSLMDHILNIKSQVERGGKGWNTDVYNTSGTYQLHEDPAFDHLHDWIFDEVEKFGSLIGFDNCECECGSSWFNFYEKYNFQEKHDHAGFDISAIYYYLTTRNTGDTVFYSPEPRSVKMIYEQENEYTWGSYRIQPQNGLLVIFKSNLIHGVSQNKSDDTRISFAYNFKIQ